ncbi:MFS transporter [Bradyrhizobium betae]
MVPGLRRNMVTICAMTATIMQALDTTIANVALPYMQGTLSASQDQINWVLTSYIVAAAIMTAPVGWISNRFGRKRIFIICAAGFTIASVLCGLAQDINQMVLFRLLQGVFGAALVPLSQSVMLDYYTLQERAKAMSIWGMGVMMGPIMGPSLGAWLTESYSWHWVFFVNICHSAPSPCLDSASSWTRPSRTPVSNSTGSALPRWRSGSARSSSHSIAANSSTGSSPVEIVDRAHHFGRSPSIIFLAHSFTTSQPVHPASRCSGIATS